MRASSFPCELAMSSCIARVFAAVLLPLSALPVWAQSADSAAEMTPVTVLAQTQDAVSTAPDIEMARQAQANIAGAVTVLDQARWREGRAATPADMLRQATGVFAASRFGSEESRLSIRGSGLQRTFHARGVMFLQDGVPLNLADGSGDFQAMEPLATRYLEVFRGANALQYGSSTLGGAINFHTPSGHDAVDEVRAELGSFDYGRIYAQLAAAGEKADAVVAASQYGQQGFQAHADQSTQRLFANMGYRNNEQLEQRLYVSAVHTDSEIPGALTEAEFRRGDVQKAAPGNVAGDYQRNFDLYRLAYKVNWQATANGGLELASFYSGKQLFHPIYQVIVQDNGDYGADLRWRQSGYAGRENDRFSLGLRLHYGSTDEDRYVNVGGYAGARTDRNTQRAENTTTYAEYTAVLDSAWSVVGNLQYIDSLRRFDDLCYSGSTPSCGGANASFSKRYEKILPRLGVIYTLAEGMQLFANASALYEPPTFGEINGVNVNRLEAQEGWSYELGSRGRLSDIMTVGGVLEWDVALYQAPLENELLAIQVAPNAYSTLNADRTLHRGVEMGVSLVPANWAQLRFNYLLNDFHFENDAVYGNNAIAGVPGQVLNADFFWRSTRGGWYAGPTVQAASSSWVDHDNQVKAPGYTVYGFKLGQQFNPALSWYLEGRNLTDKVYAATTGVVGNAVTPANQRLFNPGDGRALYAGITWAP